MDLPNRVYRLSAILDDPRYEGFKSKAGYFLNTFPRPRASRDWKISRVAKKWDTPVLTGRVRLYNDFPCVDLIHPAFSMCGGSHAGYLRIKWRTSSGIINKWEKIFCI